MVQILSCLGIRQLRPFSVSCICGFVEKIEPHVPDLHPSLGRVSHNSGPHNRFYEQGNDLLYQQHPLPVFTAKRKRIPFLNLCIDYNFSFKILPRISEIYTHYSDSATNDCQHRLLHYSPILLMLIYVNG